MTPDDNERTQELIELATLALIAQDAIKDISNHISGRQSPDASASSLFDYIAGLETQCMWSEALDDAKVTLTEIRERLLLLKKKIIENKEEQS